MPFGALAATAGKRGADARREREVKRKIREVERSTEDCDLGNEHKVAEPETTGRYYRCTPCRSGFTSNREPLFCPFCGRRFRDVGVQVFQ